jgi:low affinity Fe/Cu permease
MSGAMAIRDISATFSHIAQWTAHQCGRASTFVTACIVIVAWAVTGPLFDYSDTWQLIINTGTTIVTFLMVFLMQNTQNRDTASIQIKLDELIRANENARNTMLSLENLTEEQLQRIKASFARLADQPVVVQQKPDSEAAGETADQPQELVVDAAGDVIEPRHAHDNANAA